MKKRFWFFFLRVQLLVAMALAIYGGDMAVAYFFGEQTLAPAIAFLCLGGLVFVGSPALILFAIPLFAAESFWIIQSHSAYPHIRTLTVVLGGLLAYWACVQRRNLRESLLELDLILEKIQAPWILCDRSGTILRISPHATRLAGASEKDLLGISFFAKFSSGPSKGELIQRFLKAADGRSLVEKYSICLAEKRAATFEASLVPVQVREGSGILVILPSK